MKEIDALMEKALKFKDSGLTDYEIAEELNISRETAVWLLNKKTKAKPEGDVKIGWRSVGIFPSRISFISDALADILLEEAENRELEIDTVVGVAVNGIPFASFVADKLGIEMAVFRPHHGKPGAFSSNFASVKDKNIVIIDDVVGTGSTIKGTIKTLKSQKGKPVLCLAVINKRSQDDIEGVPLRALIRARVI